MGDKCADCKKHVKSALGDLYCDSWRMCHRRYVKKIIDDKRHISVKCIGFKQKQEVIMSKYIQEIGDTLISKMKYGVTFYPIVHGRKQERHFEVKPCKYCCDPIKAKLVKCLPKDEKRFDKPEHQYRLINSKAHDDAVYCDNVCKCLHQNELRSIRKLENKPHVRRDKRNKIEGYYVPPWTPRQKLNYNNFMARL